MLTDPFLNAALKYSSTSTGLLSLDMTSLVSGGLALVEALESAGWTVVDSAPSVAHQIRSVFYWQTAVGPGTPTEMSAAQCKAGAGPNIRRAGVGSLTYNSYDPFVVIPICPDGTNSIRWFAAGATSVDTAASLATKISADGVFLASFTGESGGYSHFTLTSTAIAFENDEVGISIGGGDSHSTRGYYKLRSPVLPSGGYLECKVETRTVNNSGAFFSFDGVGTPRICVTITASGGGTYYQPVMPGVYNFVGCESQFLLWPANNATPSRNANSSLLVSLIEAPEAHATAGSCPMVIGSNSGDLNTNFAQLQNQLHWDVSLASGHIETMSPTAYRGGNNSGYQKVTLLCRGTRGRTTRSLAGKVFIQPPYVALPSSPTSGDGPIIAGRLADMLITSGLEAVGTSMVHDGKRWQCVGRSERSADVGADLWVMTDAG